MQTHRKDLGLRRKWFFFTFSGLRRKRSSSLLLQRQQLRPTSATRVSCGEDKERTYRHLLISCLMIYELVLGIAVKTEELDIEIIRV